MAVLAGKCEGAGVTVRAYGGAGETIVYLTNPE